MITSQHPSGKTIIYNEENHSYLIKEDTNCMLVSSTTFINRFFSKFESEKVAKTFADKRDLNWKHVKSGWELKGKLASNQGNLCHDYADSICKKLPPPVAPDKYMALRFKYIKKKLKNLFKVYSKVETEKVICDIEHRIAGMVDLILETEDHILLADWKTNEKIPSTGFNGKKCLSPIENEQDCLMTKYALQVTLYKYILTSNNYTNKPIKTRIFHITPSGIIDYYIRNYDDAVENILKTRSLE